jgi:(E)-4-hydroxy-3-methylbut-2-enyl-diphosphate synthase
MTNTHTEDVAATVAQIKELTKAGCEIIRCTVPTKEAALAIKEIKKQIEIPLVADIHFDYKCSFFSWNCASDYFTTGFGKCLNLRNRSLNIFCMCISH